MTVDRRRARRRLAAFVGMLFGLLSVLCGPADPAGAHAVLVGSDPAAGAILSAAPNRVTLTFSESVQVLAGKIEVVAPDGSRADRADPTAAGDTITIPPGTGGGRGTYLVSYRVISADSHPVASSLTYSVGAVSAPRSDAGVAESVDPVVRTLIPLVKYLGYAGLVLLVGPVLVLALLWPHRLSRVGPARLVWTGIGLVLGSTVLGLWLQAPYAAGTGLFGASLGEIQDVLGSTFGAVMLVRLGVICAAAFLLRPLLRGSGGESKVDMAVLGVLGLAAVATWPLTGHPTASPVAGVAVVVDAIHLSSVAVWLGGLVMLVSFLLPKANESELAAILPIWSRWAFTAVSALILAGVVQALIEVSSFSSLFTSTYGQLILLKAGLAAAAIGVVVLSRKLLLARSAGARPHRLRGAILIELGMTAVVLGVSSVLVQVPPPRTAEAAEVVPTFSTVSQTLTNNAMSLQVDVFPAAQGNNSLHLYAYTPDNKPLTVVEWSATAAMPSKNIQPIEVSLLRITDFHAVGDVALPVSGDWTFTFTIRTSDIDRSNLTMTATIK